MIPRPLFRSQAAAVGVGLVLFVAGSWCLHDAWERRGLTPPWPVRVISWW